VRYYLRLRFFYQIIPHGWGASFAIVKIIYLNWTVNQVMAMERSHVDAILFFAFYAEFRYYCSAPLKLNLARLEIIGICPG